ncbi:hypothetical protein [Endozoicomonas arenosclerae]|uniref:hypothetical protein n=1 Tax=Endozoicomonas arenosclerae TaxID=1633495 RepID=UPI00078046A1|nr:hypothetical protein [Endozoicomonas arenosclerae]
MDKPNITTLIIAVTFSLGLTLVLNLFFTKSGQDGSLNSRDAATLDFLEKELSELNKRLDQQSDLETSFFTQRQETIDPAIIAQEINLLHRRLDEIEVRQSDHKQETFRSENKESAAYADSETLQSSEEIAESLEEAHYAQEVNRGIEPDIAATLYDDFQDNQLEGVDLEGVSCRSESCMVDIRLRNESHVDAVLDKVIRNIDWDHQHTMVMNGDSMQIHFSLQGGQLP